MIRRRLRVRGEVQGVGFRPAVLRLARRHGLGGFVRNTPAGVEVEVEGGEEAVGAFRAGLAALAPPVRVEAVEEEALAPTGEESFAIADSALAGPPRPSLPPDLVLCAACAAEIRDPADRRHGHPFASCTACGPRATIAEAPPFDRARSAMAPFPPCPRCAAEYADPADRRCHAQTICCPDCGPRLDGDVTAAAAVLGDGGLVALKGIGGFQLLCDATDADAVARLRRAKGRPDKPLAVLVRDVAAAEALVGPLPPAARELLAGPAGPVTLLPWDGAGLAPGVAPRGSLGLLLPTSPLHLLLADACAGPLVCTSGNPAGRPLATTRARAAADLGAVVDAWLDHDRAIRRPMDDSVVRACPDGPLVLRRARGLASRPVEVGGTGPAVLAVGAHLQAAPALLSGDRAWVAPHVGDLDERRTLARFDAELARLLQDHGPVDAVACDLHPDLESTRRARALAAELGVPLVPVQHHAAHAAAVLAEAGVRDPAAAVAWDGFGHGSDGHPWGGELLSIPGDPDDGATVDRVGWLRPLPLVGGDAAARSPARSALALLAAAGVEDAEAEDRARAALGAAVVHGVAEARSAGMTRPTTSVGRLFDGVAFLLGGPAATTWEGQAPTWLEHLATDRSGPSLPLDLREGVLDWGPLVAALVRHRRRGVAPDALAAAFHDALRDALVPLADLVHAPAVALCGGCFQNARLRRDGRAILEATGRAVHTARHLPPGDGGLSLGQAVLARRSLAGR